MTELYFDGASKGNPGPAGCGYNINFPEEPKKSYGGYKFLGNVTNNEAEYSAFIIGITSIIDNSPDNSPDNLPDTLYVYGDSKLVIEQLKGTWKVKAANLIPFWIEANNLSKQFKKIEFKHIDRSLNSKADMLANMAIKTSGECKNIKM